MWEKYYINKDSNIFLRVMPSSVFFYFPLHLLFGFKFFILWTKAWWFGERSLTFICFLSLLPLSSIGTNRHGLCEEENYGSMSQALTVLPPCGPGRSDDGDTGQSVLRAHCQLLPAARSGLTQRTPLEPVHPVKLLRYCLACTVLGHIRRLISCLELSLTWLWGIWDKKL